MDLAIIPRNRHISLFGTVYARGKLDFFSKSAFLPGQDLEYVWILLILPKFGTFPFSKMA